jgi:hypothetical protein
VCDGIETGAFAGHFQTGVDTVCDRLGKRVALWQYVTRAEDHFADDMATPPLNAAYRNFLRLQQRIRGSPGAL